MEKLMTARDISSGPKRDIRFVTIEPGRISLHGVALTDGEYAVLRGIAERMKRASEGKLLADLIIEAQREVLES
jgi:hypothetical protein